MDAEYGFDLMSCIEIVDAGVFTIILSLGLLEVRGD